MKKTKRSAFTIVELVIVIAVIAVLSAVLIPTFGSIIESANKAVDTQLVAQINTVLAIEDVLGGGVNDAVEIQKIVKDRGLKLQTKSKGQYIWYDIEKKQAVLGGLDENGLVLETNARAAAAPFNPDTTAPENFISGYLFLSTESADDLAENIYALRNPEGDTPEEIKASLNETLGKIENTALKNNLTAMLSTTAVMTKDGVTGFIGDNNSSVTRVIVSSEMTNISTSTISTVLAYPNVVAVDFHSGVVTAADDAITALKNRTEIPYFVYSNDELKKVDTDNDNIAFLIHKDERGNHIKKVHVVNVINNEEKTISEFTEYSFTYNLGYEYLKGTASESYDFVGYSFYEDGANPLALGEHTHELNSTEKLLIDGEGNLTVYLVYERVATDFMIGNEYYSSKTTTRKLAKGEITSGTITVVSTTATLGDETYNEITILSGVELLLPYKSDFTKGAGTSAATNGGSFKEMNFTTGSGTTQLTIPADVTLVNQGTIHVDACLYYYSTAVQSYIKENQCGVLVVNGAITSTGNITAFGVIRGSGSIAANGGTIKEVMTLYDWYGGTNAATAVGIDSTLAATASLAGYDLYGKSTVPFHNWRIQNIQVPLTMQSSTTYRAVSVANINETPVPVDFALAGPSGAVFVMIPKSDGVEGAEIVRTISDDGDAKFIISKGTVQDSAQTLTLNNVVDVPVIGSISASIDFTKISLPLSHFDVEVESDANLTVSNNIYQIMPGSSIQVNQGGVLNINTKVVICNSYDLVFESKEQYIEMSNSFSKARNVYTYSLIDGGKKLQASIQYQTRSSRLSNDWTNSGTPTTSVVTLPYTYPITTPAKLVVNGTLNFNSNGGSNAQFAGEITSIVSGVINVTGTVSGGDAIPEGFVASKAWYYTDVNGLHNAAVLDGINNGNAATLAAGTYKYVSVTQGSVSEEGWVKQ